MLVIIEGVDCTGKTSLANRIKDKLGENAEVRHAGFPHKHCLEEYETSLDGYDPRSNKHLILDRFHIGESVWPTIFERETTMTKATQIHLEMFMRSRAALYVHAVRNNDKLRKELVERNEPLKPEKLEQALTLFNTVITKVSHGVWDYERHGDQDVENFLWNAGGYALQARKIWDACGPGWVGNPSPKVLLIGDEMGPLAPGTNPPDDIPFAPYATTSGRYLLDSIEPFWKNVALVNAFSGRNHKERNLAEVWHAFGKPWVVALGKNAAKQVQKYLPEGDYGDVPHPQYWRRFHYNKREEYTNLIRAAGNI